MKKEEIIRDLEEVILDINLILNHEFSTELDIKLSHNQQMVLFLIGTREVRHVKDLAYLLNISTSAVSQIVGKLEKQKMIAEGYTPYAVALTNPNYAEAAKSFGAIGVRVEHEQELDTALEQNMIHRQPVCIDVLTTDPMVPLTGQ